MTDTFSTKPEPAESGGPREAAGALYRAVFEQSGQGIALMDSGFILTAVNPAFCRLLGYEESELLGHDYKSLILPGDLDRQPFMLHGALSGEPVGLTRLLVAKDGRTVTVDVSVRRISDNEVVMVFWDKTESIAHEEALNRERQRLRTLFDTIPGPVWALRPDMSLAATNAVYESMAGGGKSCFCSHEGPGTREPCMLCPTRDVHRTGLPASRECHMKDGRVFLINAVPFQAEDGSPLSLGLAVDITAQKRLERQLKAARKAAEAAARAKSAFLATVSHEIRTPLNSVLGHLQLLAEGQLTPEQADYARMALGSGRMLIRLIGDILDLSRIEAGKISIVNEEFCVRDILSSVQSMLGPEAEAKGLDLQCAGPDGLVLSDPARILQIAINLAGNAVKYTGEGFVRFSMEVMEDDSLASGTALVLDIRDSGPGIPKEKQSIIFDSYTQLQPTARSSFGGVGLGLSIVKRLVDAMRGNLALESEPGQGTAIRVTIPVEKPAELREEPAAPDEPARPMRLLVAEDEKVNQLVIVKALQRRGHEAHVASSGVQALEMLRAGSFDAVLMDVRMPFMDGLEAAKAIRAGEAGEAARNIPIAALSAHAMESDRELCAAAGMDAHISKPLDLAELDNVLARLSRLGPAS